jgi:hypothetical protein
LVNRRMVCAQRVVSLVLLALAAGCSSGEHYPTPSTSDGGLAERPIVGDATAEHPGDGGGDGGGGDGGAGDGCIRGGGGDGDAASSFHSVCVQIAEPAKDAVLKGSERFTPVIRVTIASRGATEPDASTGATEPHTISEVVVTVTKPGAKMPAVPSTKLPLTGAPMQVPETEETIYSFKDTPVDLAKLETGTYEMEVIATTNRGITAKAMTTFVVDAGPVIRIDSPEENEYYRESVTLSVTITDPLAPIKTVTMLVGQQALAFGAPKNNQYSGIIQFNAFNPPLEGDQLLTVTATNEKDTTTVVRRKFVSDHKGPTISSTIPDTGALIGRVITISAQVSDPAGVLDSSVVAVIAHGDKMFEVKLEPPATGSTLPVYSALFDTARLPINALFPSISFRASDLLGNQSSVGYLVSLDNTPPLADLDPPSNFIMVKNVNDVDQCSWPFDPLGMDAVDDLETVNQLFDVRARIEDQGNTPLFGGTDFTPISGIDDTRAQLLVLDDTSKALLVDTDDDGACDSVNPLLTPTTTPMSDSDALLVNLSPITPAGESNFFLSPGVEREGKQVCGGGTAAKPPPVLCGTTTMTEALYYASSTLPAIYGVPPVANDKLQCVGRQFDALGNSVKDGWICLAVAVADKLGNLQVSRPLRVCVDKDGQGGECPGNALTKIELEALAPNCTGIQTADKPDIVIDAARPCSAWRAFPTNESRRAR